MGRRKKHQHEDHVNHEAWAIPYGDLVTLLLAFFVVMYAVSSVNEGKYRVLSDSLTAAFSGSPRTLEPVPIGDKAAKSSDSTAATESTSKQLMAFDEQTSAGDAKNGRLQAQLEKIATDLEDSMQVLIERKMIRVKREPSWVEVEINTDLLFPSGSSEIAPQANEVLERLAKSLTQHPNPIRVEGHTDNRPINTLQFPSNWELSAARAARIVRMFESHGIDPHRMVVTGLGEFTPIADNATSEGRDLNRRVTLVVLGTPSVTEPEAEAAPAERNAAAPEPAGNAGEVRG